MDFENPTIFPQLSGYIPSDMSLMIRREYNSFFGLTYSLFVFHYIIAVIVNWQGGG
ncbi:hypothetical protein [Helicobacter cinaedi]|uniref:hypothetical protein n=1 Tax=Helicobacter cinaedi TaxID=213 RepID=UPI001F35D346|nr:hypothetical protein [Helicobacter cinaedi]